MLKKSIKNLLIEEKKSMSGTAVQIFLKKEI